MFIKYPKVKRLGHEDTDGILFGKVVVEEKIDGANASIWIEDGVIKCGSRTRILKDGFNGFVDFVQNSKEIKDFLEKNPQFRLYGEWLVRHTIAYDEIAYRQFYLFDVLVQAEEINEPDVSRETSEMKKKEAEEHRSRDIVRQCQWLTPNEVRDVAEKCGLRVPEVFAEVENPTPDDLQQYAGMTVLGQKGEGIVLKNAGFVNKWGDRVCAKIVTQEFKEDNGIVFGGNNKHSETYVEMKMVNEFMTLARIQKIMNKLQPHIEERLDKEHTARIIQTAYRDMFEEELWDFVKKNKQIDFGHLQKLACKKAAKIYHDILTNHISVAYARSETQS